MYLYFYDRLEYPAKRHKKAPVRRRAPPSFLLQLFQQRPQLLGHGQSNPRGVLDNRDALVRDVEADDRTPEDAAAADDVRVERVRHTDEEEDEDLLADAAKARLA